MQTTWAFTRVPVRFTQRSYRAGSLVKVFPNANDPDSFYCHFERGEETYLRRSDLQIEAGTPMKAWS